MSAEGTPELDLQERFRRQLDAMERADVGELDRLLADAFTLRHITSDVQSKAEWLEEIASGRMDYHHFSAATISVEIGDETATLTGRFVVDATIWGSRADWRLQLAQLYTRCNGEWKVTQSTASIW